MLFLAHDKAIISLDWQFLRLKELLFTRQNWSSVWALDYVYLMLRFGFLPCLGWKPFYSEPHSYLFMVLHRYFLRRDFGIVRFSIVVMTKGTSRMQQDWQYIILLEI